MSDMRIMGSMEPLGSALNVKTPSLTGADKSPFDNTLAEALQEVNEMQLNADKAIEDLVTGKTKNLHQTMSAIGKAELAFKLTMQVRNKVIEAYQEVMRTAV